MRREEGSWLRRSVSPLGWRLVTLISPFFVYVLLTRIGGIRLLESRSDAKCGGDPGYQAYKVRTPVLWLRPPAPT